MTGLRFKQLTVENFQQQDPTLSIFARLSLQDGSTRTLTVDDWAEKVLAVELSDHVPLEVQRLFAVARGAFIYGYFFYPLYTLGAEQLFRVAESAVRYKCKDAGLAVDKVEKLSFFEGVKHLVNEGVIPHEEQCSWDALRNLRNLTSHPRDQTILFAYTAIDELRHIAADINGLFAV